MGPDGGTAGTANKESPSEYAGGGVDALDCDRAVMLLCLARIYLAVRVGCRGKDNVVKTR